MKKLRTLSMALGSGINTYMQLNKLTGLSHNTIAKRIKVLREEKVVCIREWREDAAGRLAIPAFGMGDTDVPRPAAKTAAERMRATRARRSA